MENIENITIETFYKESVYKVCKDFMATYPEMGEKIFKTFMSQFGERNLKFNSVDSIVEVVYQIKWDETEEGFDYWDKLYTSLNAASKKSIKIEYV